MPIPLFDDIQLPPDATLVDVNGLDEVDREKCQAAALAAWEQSTGEELPVRDWDPTEGIFAVVENGEIVGVAIVTGIEDA